MYDIMASVIIRSEKIKMNDKLSILFGINKDTITEAITLLELRIRPVSPYAIWSSTFTLIDALEVDYSGKYSVWNKWYTEYKNSFEKPHEHACELGDYECLIRSLYFDDADITPVTDLIARKYCTIFRMIDSIKDNMCGPTEVADFCAEVKRIIL